MGEKLLKLEKKRTYTTKIKVNKIGGELIGVVRARAYTTKIKISKIGV